MPAFWISSSSGEGEQCPGFPVATTIEEMAMEMTTRATLACLVLGKLEFAAGRDDRRGRIDRASRAEVSLMTGGLVDELEFTRAAEREGEEERHG